MAFLARFMRGVALLPSVVESMETVYGEKTGAQKRAMAVSIVASAVGVEGEVAAKRIKDAERFRTALGVAVDGVVACLNESVWAR